MIQLDGTCATEVVAGELVEGFEFEPRCLVIVTALENEKELFNAMISAGRPLTDPFEIQINYTIATGTEPDVKIASTNCHNSHVLLRNYELDTTNQDVRDELAQVRTDITMYENLIAFTQHVVNSQSLVGPADSWGRVTLLSPKPSPPPPPPPVAELAGAWAPRHPPAPPETVSGRVLITRYEGLLLDREARRDELVLKLSDCLVGDRAAGTVCGLTSNEARTTLKPISDAGASAPTNADVRPPPCFLRRRPTRGWRSAASSAAATTRARRARATTADVRSAQRAAHTLTTTHPLTGARRARSQTGRATPTRWRPRPRRSATSCSRSAPFAWSRPASSATRACQGTRFTTARPTRCARNAAASPTSST